MSAMAFWRSRMARNEMSAGPSTVTEMMPVSSTGKKPFGITT